MLIENAGVLAVVTFGGGVMVWQKLPPQVRRFLQKQSLTTDLGLLVLGYVVLGGTATALLAAGMVGVLVSICLYIANHPEEFVWLFELVESVKASIKGMVDEMNSKAATVKA